MYKYSNKVYLIVQLQRIKKDRFHLVRRNNWLRASTILANFA